MRSLSDSMLSWVSDFAASPLFACSGGTTGCEVYHVLAPVLHEAGIWRSFEAYAGVVHDHIVAVLLEQDFADLLVAGIASESSAEALLATTRLFGPRVRTTFVDRCATPLNRIRAALERSDGCVRVVRSDLMDDVDTSDLGRFDIVVADAFVQQFPIGAKADVLRALRCRLADGDGRMLVREYVGVLSQLLARSVARPRAAQAAKRPADSVWPAVQDKVLESTAALNSYLAATGSLYASRLDFLDDAAACGLRVVDEYANPADVDRIFVLQDAPQDMP